jgi:hypothetical protein
MHEPKQATALTIEARRATAARAMGDLSVEAAKENDLVAEKMGGVRKELHG